MYGATHAPRCHRATVGIGAGTSPARRIPALVLNATHADAPQDRQPFVRDGAGRFDLAGQREARGECSVGDGPRDDTGHGASQDLAGR